MVMEAAISNKIDYEDKVHDVRALNESEHTNHADLNNQYSSVHNEQNSNLSEQLYYSRANKYKDRSYDHHKSYVTDHRGSPGDRKGNRDKEHYFVEMTRDGMDRRHNRQFDHRIRKDHS